MISTPGGLLFGYDAERHPRRLALHAQLYSA